MESKDGSVQETAGNVSEFESFNQRFGEYVTDVQLHVQRLKDAEHFDATANRKHSNTPQGGSMVGDEYREKLVGSSKKRQPIADCMEIAKAKRMHKLMHEFGEMLDKEQRQKEEDSEMGRDLSEKAAYAKMVLRSLGVGEVNRSVVEHTYMVYQACRKMTIQEKKRLGDAFAHLSHEGINKVKRFIAAKDLNFQGSGEAVEIDLNAQSDSTLWELKFVVEYILQAQTSSSSSGGVGNEENNPNNDTGKQ